MDELKMELTRRSKDYLHTSLMEIAWKAKLHIRVKFNNVEDVDTFLSTLPLRIERELFDYLYEEVVCLREEIRNNALSSFKSPNN